MASMIKYHAIIYVLFIFVFTVICEKKLFKKMVVVSATVIVCAFIGNYIIGFSMSNIDSYHMYDYFVKLWDYIGGSIINGNICISEASHSGYTVSDIVFSSTIPLINTIVGAVSGKTFITTNLPLGFRRINTLGSTSNVAGMIFCVYYTDSILFFVLYLLVWGFIVELIIIKIHKCKRQTNLLFYSMLLTISMLTFFANYFELSMIWELVIWCYLIPKLFTKNHRKIRIVIN